MGVGGKKQNGGFFAFLVFFAVCVGLPSLAVNFSTRNKKNSAENSARIQSEKITYEFSDYVCDNAEIFSPEEKKSLSKKLSALDSETGIQLAVLTVRTTDGESIESFSIRHAEKWRLGKSGADNGILLTVAVDDKSVRIETGYGSEGVLTDADCSKILRNEMIPFFKGGNFAKGILCGTDAIIAKVKTDDSIFSAENNDEKNSAADDSAEKKSDGVSAVTILFLIFIYGIVFISIFSGTGRRGIFFMPVSRGSHFHGGNFSSGSGHSSGGGFSGGHGGSFGGGGASGHW